jgi:predicted ester cyclase
VSCDGRGTVKAGIGSLDATGIATMMADFLSAFPDLVYTFDQFIAADDFVVERYTATGTPRGLLGDIPASGRVATWTGINIFASNAGELLKFGPKSMQSPAPSS